MSLMVLSKAAPHRIAAQRGSGAGRGRPVGPETRAIEARIDRDETVATLIDIRRHAGRVHLAVVADRPDLALHAAGQITSLAERRLRQITGGDAA